MTTPRVFVSHSHLDNEFTLRFVGDLRNAGIEIWLDVASLKDGNFLQRINEALIGCDWLVLVQTPDALRSPAVRMEVDAAIQLVWHGRMRGVIPFIAEPCDPNEVPPTWAVLQHYDGTKDYAQALAALVKTLTQQGVPSPLTRPSAPARQSTLLSPPAGSASGRRIWMVVAVVGILLSLSMFTVLLLSPSSPLRTAAPTATSSPMVCGPSVDMGNPQSEAVHDLSGWGGVGTDPPSPSGDITFRYQPQHSAAVVTLCVARVGIGYTLTTEVQDFGCDDSFEIFLNIDPTPIYRYTGTRANLVRVHTVTIPAAEITSRDVVLGFESISKDCGIAAVYNIGLTPTPG